MDKVCVDLCCGAGLASEGLILAGFHIILAVDNDPLVLKSYAMNHDALVLKRDLLFGDLYALLEEGGIKRTFRGLIWISPPCQNFSSAKQCLLKNIAIQKACLDMVANAAAYAPNAWIVMENVPNLLSCEFLGEFTRRIRRSRGIFVDKEVMQAFIFNANTFGVAQNRKRLILPIPPQGGRFPTLPKPLPVKTMQVIRDEFKDPDALPVPMSDFEKELFDGMPPGGNWRDTKAATAFAHRKFGDHPPAGFLRRSAWNDIPSCVMALLRPWLKDGHFVHPDDLRRFTIGEMREFQAVPHNYLFYGRWDQRLHQIGNGVPPPMAAGIAGCLQA